MEKYNEHVNNHQVDFCDQVAKRQRNIIVVNDISRLGDVIETYDELVARMQNGVQSNNERFLA